MSYAEWVHIKLPKFWCQLPPLGSSLFTCLCVRFMSPTLNFKMARRLKSLLDSCITIQLLSISFSIIHVTLLMHFLLCPPLPLSQSITNGLRFLNMSNKLDRIWCSHGSAWWPPALSFQLQCYHESQYFEAACNTPVFDALSDPRLLMSPNITNPAAPLDSPRLPDSNHHGDALSSLPPPLHDFSKQADVTTIQASEEAARSSLPIPTATTALPTSSQSLHLA